MAAERANITLGTAGHIDHGKTALVKLLTGCETDRLKEEKERGMSIDLGFAPCQVAGLEVGIVDVPGHENFIKTMVAGASGIDGVVLVVAANDGVMPQTREHLDILTLLGVNHGLVALTKIDRVEADHVELARAELNELLRGTFLQRAAVCPLSSVTGEGFDRFYEALAELVRGIRPKPIDGVFRMPLDRAFSAAGYGTVVAGIPVSGSAKVGDEVVLLPQATNGTIRQIEVYGRSSQIVMAGQCAALNMRHWDHRAIRRGHSVAACGYFQAHEWLAATLRLLERENLSASKLKAGSSVRLHTGTSEVTASIYPIGGDRLQPGQEHLVQIRAKTPVVAGPGDRFILRALSPARTIGGGMIIEPLDRRLRQKKGTGPICRDGPKGASHKLDLSPFSLAEDLSRRAEAVPHQARFVEYCIRHADSQAATKAGLAIRAKLPPHRLDEILAELLRQEEVVPLASGLYMHRATLDEAGRRLVALVEESHRRRPESPGPTREELRGDSALDKPVFDGLTGLLTSEGRLVEAGGRLAAPSHRATFADEDAEHLAAIEGLFRSQAFHPPGLEELVEKTGADRQTAEKILRILLEHQRLVRVAEGLFFHREAVDRARRILVDFLAAEGRLESVRFKYLLDTTRKIAIPLLDYFDRDGITRRVGNTRLPKPPRPAAGPS